MHYIKNCLNIYARLYLLVYLLIFKYVWSLYSYQKIAIISIDFIIFGIKSEDYFLDI